MERQFWIKTLLKSARPLWTSLAEGRFGDDFPNEHRCEFQVLEAVARSFSGIAPWINSPTMSCTMEKERIGLRKMVLKALTLLSQRTEDENLKNSINWSREGEQPIVDAGFLAQGFIRAPLIWNDLGDEAKAYYISGFKASRACEVNYTNWLLFAAMVETFLMSQNHQSDAMRIDYALRSHDNWYLQGGLYGDGPKFTDDYYNSYVIHPFLMDIIEAVGKKTNRWETFSESIHSRAKIYSQAQENMIHVDGTYPPKGRSITYRCGAFHALAQAILKDNLHHSLRLGQVKNALGLVIKRTLGCEQNYHPEGWLKVGLSREQPELAEPYISQASLYICHTAFLPLGLKENHPFGQESDSPITHEKVWN